MVAKVVSERLGPLTIVLTLDTYLHVLPDMQQQATERFKSYYSHPVPNRNVRSASTPYLVAHSIVSRHIICAE